MAKHDGTLDNKDLALYNYDVTKDHVEKYFVKYRNLKDKADTIRKRTKSCLDSLDNLGIFNSIISNPTHNKVEQLERITKFIDLTDEIINLNEHLLNSDEKIILKKQLKAELTNEEVVSIMGRDNNYLNEKRKSCIVKVATWFNLEVYNENVL